jgi:hypothetical protein
MADVICIFGMAGAQEVSDRPKQGFQSTVAELFLSKIIS